MTKKPDDPPRKWDVSNPPDAPACWGLEFYRDPFKTVCTVSCFHGMAGTGSCYEAYALKHEGDKA